MPVFKGPYSAFDSYTAELPVMAAEINLFLYLLYQWLPQLENIHFSI